jgi:hypothetical protein
MTPALAVSLVAAGLTSLVLTACSKDEEAFTSATAVAIEDSTATATLALSPTGTATLTATSTAIVPPTAAATLTATSTATVPPTAAATRLATSTATLTASSTSSPCGDRPLRPCTLRDWMKANTGPAMMSQDFDALAEALDRVATFAPTGYPNWASIARDGASAAQVLDLEAVRAACRSCHSQYKDRYKRELHDRPI